MLGLWKVIVIAKTTIKRITVAIIGALLGPESHSKNRY